LKKLYYAFSNLLKNRKGSPLLEEGMLIALAIMTLAVIFSIALGILGEVQEIVENMGFTTDNFVNSLDALWNKILAFLGLQS